MKRVLGIFLCVLLLCTALVLPAAAQPARLVDDADLLSSSEESQLLQQLDEISQRQQLDIVVVTTDTLDGQSPRDYADDFFDYNGYGYGANRDGILLLISMEDRDWWISTSGYGITAFTDAGIAYIGEELLFDLGEGYYADAFTLFAQLCDDFITQARTGAPYDVGNMPAVPFPAVFMLVISLVVGLIVALIATAVMKGQLKSVRRQDNAGSYLKQGSLKLTQSDELYLYRNVSMVKRETNSGGSSTHTSSSGRTHGGGGGKF